MKALGGTSKGMPPPFFLFNALRFLARLGCFHRFCLAPGRLLPPGRLEGRREARKKVKRFSRSRSCLECFLCLVDRVCAEISHVAEVFCLTRLWGGHARLNIRGHKECPECRRMSENVKETEQEQDDLYADYDEDEEKLEWSWKYLRVCILLPCFNGFIIGYSWSGLSLHFVDMGWSVSRVGWPCMMGFLGRMLFQQVQMRAGFWVSVPLSSIHLASAIVGLIFPTDEWPCRFAKFCRFAFSF